MVTQAVTVGPPAPPVPLLRGWFHVGGAVVLPACAPLLYDRCHTTAAAGWVTAFLVGVETMLVVSSTLHRGHWAPRTRRRWQRADLVAIFVAIAGTYLALDGLTLHGDIRWVLLGLVALAGAISAVLRYLVRRAHRWATALPYLIVGWVAVGFLPQILRGGGFTVLALIMAGGVAYSVGAYFYATQRPNPWPRVFGYHEVFHVCTLLGAGSHFAAVYLALGR